MGSQDGAAAPPQQPVDPQHSAGTPSPLRTRLAAAPYFSRTAAVSSSPAWVEDSDIVGLDNQEILIGDTRENGLEKRMVHQPQQRPLERASTRSFEGCMATARSCTSASDSGT